VSLGLLKPVDLQTIIPRSIDIQRVQQIHNLRPNHEQVQFARELLQVSKERQLKVNHTTATDEGTRIREDASDEPSKHSSPRYRRFNGKKRVSAENAQGEEDSGPEPGHHIDIKI
jgi:hypothetical protein